MDQRTKKIIIGSVLVGVLLAGIGVGTKRNAGGIMVLSVLGIVIGGGIGLVATAT